MSKTPSESLHRTVAARWVGIFPKVSNKIHLKTTITQAAVETGVSGSKLYIVLLLPQGVRIFLSHVSLCTHRHHEVKIRETLH